MRARISLGATVTATLVVTLGGPAHAVDEPAQRLIYAEYRSEVGATETLKAAKAAEDKKALKVDAYAVLTKDSARRVVQIKSQRQGRTRAGAAVGAVVDAIGAPGSLAFGVLPGGGIAYLTSITVGMPKENVSRIRTSLGPGQSAIILVVDERWADGAMKLLAAGSSSLLSQSMPSSAALTDPTKIPPAETFPGEPPPRPYETVPTPMPPIYQR